jgi:hypothetical protein
MADPVEKLPYSFNSPIRLADNKGEFSEEATRRVIQEMWRQLATVINKCCQRGVSPSEPSVQNIIRTEILKVPTGEVAEVFPDCLCKPDENKAAIIGGLLSRLNGAPARACPFLTPGSGSQIAKGDAMPLPSGAWIFNGRNTQKDAEPNQTLYNFGFSKNDNHAGSGIRSLYWDYSVGPLTGAFSVHGNGNEAFRYEQGDVLHFINQAQGVASGTPFPVWTACYLGDGGVIPLGMITSAQPNGITVYFSGMVHVTNDTTEANIRIVPPAGTLKWMTGRIIAAQPASLVNTITVRKDAVDTNLELIVPASAADGSVFQDLTDTVTFNGTTNVMTVRIAVTGGGGGNAAPVVISFGFVPTTLNTAILPFAIRRGAIAGPHYHMPWDGVFGGSSVEGQAITPLPRAGTLTNSNCVLYLTTALTGGNTASFKLRVNGAASGLVWNLNSSTPIGAVTATGGPVAVSEGDYLSIEETASGGGGFIATIRLFLV